ncbi:MAG: cupin domain-containing protein, partial [Aquabacterium sp.]|nr:cupin domain-containing protein [Aquabacterium sp.]
MDTLSLILDDMRLQGSVFVYTHASAPWSLRLHTPGVAAFHIITGGSAWLLREGREPLALQAGDLVILPSGDDHRVQDRPGHEGPPTDLLPLISAPNRPDEPLRLGGGGTATRSGDESENMRRVRRCGAVHCDSSAFSRRAFLDAHD